jgi:adenylylsulfate kinase
MYKGGWCVWITGLPGSGKSLIARVLLEKLESRQIHAQIVSSDMLRRVITPVPKYTEEERDMVYIAILLVAKLLTQNGVNVIIDATANRRRYRDRARKAVSRFIEAYIQCPLEVCVKREGERKAGAFYAPRDIYAKAFTGKSKTVPGIGVSYEEPLHPEVIANSDKLDPSQCAQKILEVIIRLEEA